MRTKLRAMKAFWMAGAIMLAAIPATASAHDAVGGGDELAVANWMLVAAMVTIVIGCWLGYWAFRTGQFSNVEESKYNMLDTAEDFDAIMEESDAREKAEQERSRLDALRTTTAPVGTKAANPTVGEAVSTPSR